MAVPAPIASRDAQTIPPVPVRKLCWAAAACSAAIFLAVYLLPERYLFPAGVFCVPFLFLARFFRGKVRPRMFLAALGLCLGFLWTGVYGLLFRAPARALADADPAEYTFQVVDFPRANGWGASVLVKLQLEGAPDPKVQLYAGEDALELLPGDLFSCPAALARSDFRRGEAVDYYQSKGIYLLGYARDGITLLHSPGTVSPRYWPLYASKALKESILQVFPADVSGFLAALITGDKRYLPTGLYAAFQRSGAAHIVAVSGLHISFLAGMMAFLFGRHSRRSAALSIALMFFFAALAGNTPSALRAAFMSSLLLIAPLVKREPDKPTILSAVLCVLLLPCPDSAASVSLQLSFAAVAGIYLLSEKLIQRWGEAIPKRKTPLGKLVRRSLFFLASSLAVSLGALIFTTPLAALHFHSVSLVGPLTNLLTLWAVSAAFLGGIAAALAGLALPSVGAVLGWIAAWPAKWVLFVVRGVARWPFAAISLLSGVMLYWFLFSYAVLLLWGLSRGKVRSVFPIGFLLLSFCLYETVDLLPKQNSLLTVAALDVGQGSSTLFYSKGHAVLVDCGGNGGDDPGDTAADFLQSLGSSHLDALVLTHCHSDHAGGVPELFSRLEITRLILPETARENPLCQEILPLAEESGCKVDFLSNDSNFTFGEASMELYAPLGDGGVNEEGLSVLCTAGDFDALVTGDMNDVVERRLVKYKSLPDIELLVVGHHGSRSATSEELLIATAPESAVISSGYNNYGHPSPETLERLGAAGCDIYRTDQMGTVTFTWRGE